MNIQPPFLGQSDIQLLAGAAMMVRAETARLRVLHARAIGGARMAWLISGDLHVTSAALRQEAVGRRQRRRARPHHPPDLP